MAFACVVLTLSACGRSRKQNEHDAVTGTVYVCPGPHAKRYHYDSSCDGLSNCSGEILEMTTEEAEERGRTPCRMCVE